MKIKIENRPLTYIEKAKFHPNLAEIINAYEYYTKQKFMRFDVAYLDRIIKCATPAQIIAVIEKASKGKYADNFTYFGYIEPLVKNQFSGRIRGGK